MIKEIKRNVLNGFAKGVMSQGCIYIYIYMKYISVIIKEQRCIKQLYILSFFFQTDGLTKWKWDQKNFILILSASKVTIKVSKFGAWTSEVNKLNPWCSLVFFPPPHLSEIACHSKRAGSAVLRLALFFFSFGGETLFILYSAFKFWFFKHKLHSLSADTWNDSLKGVFLT